MKIFSYKEEALTLFKLLKSHTPNRIFSDQICRVVFDYRDFHIVASLDIFKAASQNKWDEVILTEFKRIDSAFQSNQQDLLIFQNKAINRLWILRTILYFTDAVPFDSEAKALEEPNPILADLIRQSPSTHEEIVCHPKSPEVQTINQEFVNLVEAGIILEIDSQLLVCFATYNGFSIVGETMSDDEIKKEIASDYEFIEI